jgi:DNA-binding PucR family transcriptional regulator
MRQGAQLIADDSEQWADELHRSMLISDHMRPLADHPQLADAIRLSNRTYILHWARANIDRPGQPVSADLGVEPLPSVLDAIRGGLDEAATEEGSRIGQVMVSRGMAQTAFALTSDVTVLRELLDSLVGSMTSFIDGTVAAVCGQIHAVRDEATGVTDAERDEIIAHILAAAPISPRHAEKRLGYRLDSGHTAAVLWQDGTNDHPANLDRAVEALTHATDGAERLAVVAGPTTRWVWLSGAGGPDTSRVAAAMRRLPGVRIAVGPTAPGIDGFRCSHLDAVTTQRIMKQLGSSERVVKFTDVELVALVTADPERAERFVRRTLGDLEGADAELQRTVLTFINEGCNASRTAARLYVHRNTLQRRLTRANELLPLPIEDASVQVAMALEALRWRGTPGIGQPVAM